MIILIAPIVDAGDQGEDAQLSVDRSTGSNGDLTLIISPWAREGVASPCSPA
jgi:hypothetical protein